MSETRSATTRRYRGVLRLGCHGEAEDILFLAPAGEELNEDGTVTGSGRWDTDWPGPLAEVVAEDIEQLGQKDPRLWRWTAQVSVRYWTADEPCTDDAMIEGALRELMGAGDARFHHAYSDITGYLWTDEELNIGGHDLLAELRSQIGRYCLLEITYM